jgi:hypothetical protein
VGAGSIPGAGTKLFTLGRGDDLSGWRVTNLSISIGEGHFPEQFTVQFLSLPHSSCLEGVYANGRACGTANGHGTVAVIVLQAVHVLHTLIVTQMVIVPQVVIVPHAVIVLQADMGGNWSEEFE